MADITTSDGQQSDRENKLLNPSDMSYDPTLVPASPWLPGQREEVLARKKSSNFQSWMNSAKLCFGNAYLSIPNVFSKTGWLGGIALFVVIGILNIYTMVIQIKIAERHPKLHSYSEIGCKIFGKRGKLAVDIPIWIS